MWALMGTKTYSPAAPYEEIEAVLRLYRDRSGGCNVRHFQQVAKRENGVRLSYSYVKKALQEAGLVKKWRARAKHRRRRERRPCLGQMLHIDGSLHPWLALKPDDKQMLIAVIDDATSQVLYAQLEASDSCTANDPDGSSCDDGQYCNGYGNCVDAAAEGSADDGGCSCRTPGRAPCPLPGPLARIGLALLLARRRRPASGHRERG